MPLAGLEPAACCSRPYGDWATLGVDPQVVAGAVIGAWRGGHLEALQSGALIHEEALGFERPAMIYGRMGCKRESWT